MRKFKRNIWKLNCFSKSKYTGQSWTKWLQNVWQSLIWVTHQVSSHQGRRTRFLMFLVCSSPHSEFFLFPKRGFNYYFKVFTSAKSRLEKMVTMSKTASLSSYPVTKMIFPSLVMRACIPWMGMVKLVGVTRLRIGGLLILFVIFSISPISIYTSPVPIWGEIF